MRRLIVLLTAVCLLLPLTMSIPACGKTDGDTDNETAPDATIAPDKMTTPDETVIPDKPDPTEEPPVPDTVMPELTEQEIKVSLTVPDTGWEIAIEEVYQVGDALWIISQLTRLEGMHAQMISRAEAKCTIKAPPLRYEHVVLGRTWLWKNTEPYRFIKDLKDIEKDLKGGTRYYQREQ